MNRLQVLKRFDNSRIARKLYFIIGIMGLLIAIELLTLIFAVNTLSSVRSYVQGEGLWSKAQKDAVYHLLKYGRMKYEHDYTRFLDFMKVPTGDHRARMELQKENPDLDMVRQGFIEGRNHPDDVNGMIKLFRRFYNIYYIHKAMTIWSEADSISGQLLPIGQKLKGEIRSLSPDEKKIEAYLNEINEINQKLTVLEDNFSFTLGEGSRWLERLIFSILFSVALTVELTGLLLTIFVSRRITKGINEIIRVSRSVADGNFKEKAKVFSMDETGQLANSFNQMIEQLEQNIVARKEAEIKQNEFNILKQAEKKFRIAIEAAPNALIMMDNTGKIILVNRQTEKLFGYSRNELVGKNIKILIPSRNQKDFPGYWSLLINANISDESRAPLVSAVVDKSGFEFTVEIGVNPLETEDGIMVLSNIIDITQRKKDEEQLRDAKEKAEQMSMARQEFLSVMSHEMRTPLNAVVGISHLLAEGDLTPEQEENINILQFSAQSLLSLINNILDFSKIESGMLQMEKIDFDINKLIRRVMDSFRHNATEKQVKLNLQVAMDIPDILNGDPARLTQVLTNLIHNAIKFTDHGEVSLSVKTINVNEEKATIRFLISDTGIGIEEERLEEIFDSYTQAKPSITRQFGGTGLGLTICKKLVRMMGGEITVKSELNKGSEFAFYLEFPIGNKDDQAKIGHRHERDFDLTGIRILLVEDNVTNQALAKKFINRWGAIVDTAENGLVAVKKVNEARYDVVLMDLQMPVMDGYKANRIIRDLGYTSEKLPVIALSAYILDEVKTKVRAAGMDDYLSKPIDPYEMYRKIVKNIKRKNRNINESFLIADDKVEILTIEQLMDSFDGSFRQEFLRVLEKEFKDFKLKIFAAAKGGKQEEVRQIIHKINPSLQRFKEEKLVSHLNELKTLLTENSSDEAIEIKLNQIDTDCAKVFYELNNLKVKFATNPQ